MKTLNIKDILDRLKVAMEVSSDNELAEKLGVTKSALSNWKARNTIDFSLVFSKCERINVNWLLSGEGNMNLIEEEKQPDVKIINPIPFIRENLVKVRYLDIAPTASFTEYASIPPEEYDFTYILPKPGEEIGEDDCVFPVHGDSMEPRIPNKAEVLGTFIKKSQWHWAKGVVLISYNDSFVIKRILENKLDTDNYLILGSDNPEYPKTVKVPLNAIQAMFKADRIVSSNII